MIFFSSNLELLNMIMFIMYILNYPCNDSTFFWHIVSVSKDNFDSDNYEKIDSIKTCSNKRGIFGISSDAKKNIISYPSTEIGKIIIKNY